MARTPTITDQALLAHAREVFLERGVRATTAEVAERAGVSEALLFKRFRTKDRLFREAMSGHFSAEDVGWLAGIEARVGQGDLREHMVELGIEAVRFFRKLMPLILMSWSNMTEEELGKQHGHPKAPPFVARRRLEAYFEAERLRGRIRASCDTEILARFYTGALFHHVVWEMTIGRHDPRPLGAEAFVRGMVELLFSSIAPNSERG